MGEAKRRAGGWTAFQPAVHEPMDERRIVAMAADTGVSVEEVRTACATLRQSETIWLNNRYQVNVRFLEPEDGDVPPLVHLSIKRRDKAALGPERFRDLQRIKNEIAGPECEAVEIYPAESRLVDTANQYHLWVFPPGYRLPFGFNERLVLGHSSPESGARQQPFAEAPVPPTAGVIGPDWPHDPAARTAAVQRQQQLVSSMAALQEHADAEEWRT